MWSGHCDTMLIIITAQNRYCTRADVRVHDEAIGVGAVYLLQRHKMFRTSVLLLRNTTQRLWSCVRLCGFQ